MASEPDRCPLCGGERTQSHRLGDCGLPAKHWPRVRELVAIRDAAVKWFRSTKWKTEEKLYTLLEKEARRLAERPTGNHGRKKTTRRGR